MALDTRMDAAHCCLLVSKLGLMFDFFRIPNRWYVVFLTEFLHFYPGCASPIAGRW